MTENFLPWWQARSPRERALLATMFGLLALVLAWLLVVRPLADALGNAQRRHAAAVVALAEARGRPAAPGAPTASPQLPIDSLVGRTAAEAGFTGARVTAQGPARANVAIDAARPQALFGWIAALEQQGLAIESFRARANNDRTVAMEAVLAAPNSR